MTGVIFASLGISSWRGKMIGFNLEIPNEWGNVLSKLFSGIPLENKKIKSYYSEVHLKGLEQQLFDEDNYSGEEFIIAISKEDYYILSLSLDFFPANSIIANRKISSLDEFKNCDCELVLRIIDCEFASVFAKNPVILAKIHDNIISQGYAYSEVSEEDANNNPKYYFDNQADISDKTYNSYWLTYGDDYKAYKNKDLYLGLDISEYCEIGLNM